MADDSNARDETDAAAAAAGSQAPTDDRDHGDRDHGDRDDALVSRLKLIEQQPLESRAEAFARVHEELRSRLEGGDERSSS